MTTTIIIELKIKHAPKTDPYAVVDRALDHGLIQRPVNHHNDEDEGPCEVTSALCFSVPGFMRRLGEKTQ